MVINHLLNGMILQACYAMERIIFPASFLNGEQLPLQDVLNMWGHRFKRILGSQSFLKCSFSTVLPPQTFSRIFVSTCCYRNMKLVCSQPHISFVWKKINTTKNAIQRLQSQRFRGKNGGTRWDGTLNNQPHIYTLYSGYHPKGPPPFSL